MTIPTVSLLIDLPADHRFHVATANAVRHAADHLGVEVRVEVAGTDRIGALGDGVVIGPGSPYRDPDAAEAAIRAARVEGRPLVAT